jgi:hypothetical protein
MSTDHHLSPGSQPGRGAGGAFLHERVSPWDRAGLAARALAEDRRRREVILNAGRESLGRLSAHGKARLDGVSARREDDTMYYTNAH